MNGCAKNRDGGRVLVSLAGMLYAGRCSGSACRRRKAGKPPATQPRPRRRTIKAKRTRQRFCVHNAAPAAIPCPERFHHATTRR